MDFHCKQNLKSLSQFGLSALVLVILGVGVAQATSSKPYLVKDINANAEDSSPYGLTNLNGVLLFSADDGASYRKLYKSDGTGAGTMRLKDIDLGYGFFRTSLIKMNDGLFFSADDGVHGRELWVSDGTEAGTVLVKDIKPGPGDSDLVNMANVNGVLFFRTDDGVHGAELWKSDGTEAGTVLVKDIRPWTGDSSLYELTDVHGTLFFRADDGVHGDELWKSDGTEAGTVLVKDIKPGSGSSSPASLTQGNDVSFDQAHNVLYFNANDGVYGRELWMSDGTDLGTVRVLDINPGQGSSNPQYMVRMGDVYFFSADDGIHGQELWARNPGAELALSQKVSTSAAFLLPRDIISYTLTYRNVGDAVASGVVISDLLPAGLTQLNVTNSGAAITSTPGITYAWQVADLEPGQGGVISITAMIDPAFPGGALTNTATISSAMAEFSGANNNSAAAVTVNPPELRVFKTAQGENGATANVLPANSVVTYSITLDNSLNELAAGVVMSDPLPAGVLFGGWVQQGSAQLPPPAGTGTLDAEVIRWGPWGIPAGEEVSLVFTATVASGSAFIGTPVVNTAWFSSTNAGSGSASAVFSIKVMDIFLPVVIKQ